MTVAMLQAKRLVRQALPHPVYRLYRRQRIARQIAAYQMRSATHTYAGTQLTVLLADPLAEGWYDHDWEESEEIAELVRIGALRDGALVFDLGAHQAVVAMMLAAQVGPSGRVVAVEAEPHNARIAVRNVELNGAENVTVVHAAVGDRSGTVSFASGLNGHVDDATQRGNDQVRSVTIDELATIYGPPDVVLLDVEGYEGKALVGAREILRRRRATFLVEVHGDELVDCDVSRLAGKFAGYRLAAARPSRNGGVADFVPCQEPPFAGRFFLTAIPGG